MYIVCSPTHSFAGRPDISGAELAEETWIIREPGSGTREATEKMFAVLQFRPDNIMEFGSTQIIKESVEAGLGISLLSEWTVRKEVSAGSLKLVAVHGCGPVVRHFSLVTPASLFRTRAADIFLEVLKNKEGFPEKGI
jgi:LysR family transcriptional regulator, transcriptional activator of the cysJI operon